MKVFRLLVMLAFLLVGLIIGAVNSQDVTLDFLFPVCTRPPESRSLLRCWSVC